MLWHGLPRRRHCERRRQFRGEFWGGAEFDRRRRGFVAERRNQPPILLLDDILSELDNRRRGYLLSTISGQEYQALITTADLAGFDPGFLEKATLLEVRQGEVLEAGSPEPEPVGVVEAEAPRKRSRAKKSA